MAETSNIAWTDSTFNPVIGCSKIGPGCDHCYAEAQDSRKRWGGVTHWGPGVPRHRTSEANWKQPLAWNRKAERAGKRSRVFCASLADVFDNEWPEGTRKDLWKMIDRTPWLDWLLLTKRIGNVPGMVPQNWLNNCNRWHWPVNVRLMITVVNQEEADRDIPKLLALPCKNGISYEPALGNIDWCETFGMRWNSTMQCFESTGRQFNKGTHGHGIDWIICGGESSQPGHPARPFNVQWARSTIAQCKAAGVPVFVKQLGSNVLVEDATCPLERAIREGGYTIKDRAGADPSEWAEDLRVREFPE